MDTQDPVIAGFLADLRGGDVFSALALADYLDDTDHRYARQVRSAALTIQQSPSMFSVFAAIQLIQAILTEEMQ